jgi:hypothetical protein
MRFAGLFGQHRIGVEYDTKERMCHVEKTYRALGCWNDCNVEVKKFHCDSITLFLAFSLPEFLIAAGSLLCYT